VRATTHSLARQFDRIVGLLRERGYLDGDEVTAHGRALSRLWGETDLLVAECLRHGLWDHLDPADLASVVSALVYESRRDLGGVPRVPSGPVAEALSATTRLWSDLEHDERRHKLDRTREPDAGFAWPVHRWARGQSLSAVLTAAAQNGQELAAGDFVRWCRMVIDLLDQLVGVAGKEHPVGRSAAAAIKELRRGVVSAGA
jgi:ATP-dependent RNA helicase HelY